MTLGEVLAEVRALPREDQQRLRDLLDEWLDSESRANEAPVDGDQRLRVQFEPLTLISADTALNEAALAEGLIVDNPNSHP